MAFHIEVHGGVTPRSFAPSLKIIWTYYTSVYTTAPRLETLQLGCDAAPV
jgi:hypothetical protein